MSKKYIDAERLKKCFHINVVHGEAFDTIIDMQPAADVRENVKGEWIDGFCNKCGHDGGIESISDGMNFCPHCGADMRGEQED